MSRNRLQRYCSNHYKQLRDAPSALAGVLIDPPANSHSIEEANNPQYLQSFQHSHVLRKGPLASWGG